MNRTAILRYLAQAERHVSAGETILARQRRLIFFLQCHGQCCRAAYRLLTMFDQLQAMHIRSRNRLRADLA